MLARVRSTLDFGKRILDLPRLAVIFLILEYPGAGSMLDCRIVLLKVLGVPHGITVYFF